MSTIITFSKREKPRSANPKTPKDPAGAARVIKPVHLTKAIGYIAA